MPRHRKKREPPYWPRRQAVNAARRVQLSAAVQAPVPASTDEPSTTLPLIAVPSIDGASIDGASAGGEPAEASATLQMPAFQRRLLQAASPAGPTAVGGASSAARAMRRMLITPWFAVATGFVVAAGMWIYSPHAELRFPNGSGGEVLCMKAADCRVTTPKNPGIPASAATLPITSAVKSAGKMITHRPRHLTYRVLWQSQGKIAILISFSGKHIPRTWRLAFALPGDVIIGVEGASWQPSASYAGTVSWPAPEAPWQTLGPGDGGDQNGRAPGDKAGAGFVVVASGVTGTPINCSFNGASCKFSFAPATTDQTAPSGTQNH